MLEVSICAAISLSVIVGMLFVRRHQSMAQKRAERIARSLDDLMHSETSILTFSCSVEGYETVCVADTWTGWAEQCFYNTTLEGALEDAVRTRNAHLGM